jgi:hypothetical protein
MLGFEYGLHQAKVPPVVIVLKQWFRRREPVEGGGWGA